MKIAVTLFAGKNASAVSLQGGEVYPIVSDWIWVARQRSNVAVYRLVPGSRAVGGFMGRPDAGFKSLDGLRGRVVVVRCWVLMSLVVFLLCRRVVFAGVLVGISWFMLVCYVRDSLCFYLK